MAKAPVKVEIARHPEFRVIHVDGAMVGLTPDDGLMKFYLDIIEPKIKPPGYF